MNSPAKLWAVVPAAGIGARMGAEIAKQYLPLSGATVIEQSLRKLLTLPQLSGIVVALRDGDNHWSQLAISREDKVFTTLGGGERADSVLAALLSLQKKAQPHDWVLVHDAARPCVRATTLAAMVESLWHHPVGGILATPAADTLKQAEPDQQLGFKETRQTLDRAHIWQAQTPQMFRLGDLTQALEHALSQGFAVTDEASAMEHAGHPVALFAGERDNLKITNPEDLPLAEFILSQQK